MFGKSPKILGKSPKRVSRMDKVLEAKALMHECFPSLTYGSVQRAIWKAYTTLKLRSERRARSLYHGEAPCVYAEEMDALREEKARQDAAKLVVQFNRTIAHLREKDPDFYRPTITQLERVVRSAGVSNSAVADEGDAES